VINEVLFKIPEMYLAGVQSGSLIRFGSILKEAGTGKIVAHLQETGLGQQMLSTAVGSISSPLSLVPDIAQTVMTYQALGKLNEIKDAINVLQSLQIATLGISVVGVGVSLAGFIYLKTRLDKVDSKIEEVLSLIRSERGSTLRARFSRLKGLVASCIQAYSMSNPDYEYARIAEELAIEAAFYEEELLFLTKSAANIDLQAFGQLSQRLLLCNSLRIDCRVRTNELFNAQVISESVANSYALVFDQLTPSSFTGDKSDRQAICLGLREISEFAATKAHLFYDLRKMGADGSDYIQKIESSSNNAFLMLRAA
jgi:hypothetical protein